MKGRTILLALAALIVVGVVAAAIIPKGTAEKQYREYNQVATAPSAIAQTNGGVQEVTLSLKNSYYVITPQTLKAGVPVRMTVDLATVTGCTKSIVIPALGVRKRVSPGDNVITFTPLQTGTIQMSCSMGMATGSFNVVADAGQNYQPAPQNQGVPEGGNAGGSCGAGGGGCGCGG